MLGKKKFKHPADAFRKRLRKKEIKRNKEQRDERRNQIILAKDEDSLKAEIKKYDLLESKNRLEPRHKIIKQKLKTALNAKIAEKVFQIYKKFY
ncbi:hypothetical protein MHBO_005280 [Bonamia ostreae]|uniref:Wbp11/ELF5/Saf1 N-terminal domain-containing protein n=1 Tax=Bonamia ostreae TaxID=126728 RepID=A0ABV2AGE0_9EUKA